MGTRPLRREVEGRSASGGASTVEFVLSTGGQVRGDRRCWRSRPHRDALGAAGLAGGEASLREVEDGAVDVAHGRANADSFRSRPHPLGERFLGRTGRKVRGSAGGFDGARVRPGRFHEVSLGQHASVRTVLVTAGGAGAVLASAGRDIRWICGGLPTAALAVIVDAGQAGLNDGPCGRVMGGIPRRIASAGQNARALPFLKGGGHMAVRHGMAIPQPNVVVRDVVLGVMTSLDGAAFRFRDGRLNSPTPQHLFDPLRRVGEPFTGQRSVGHHADGSKKP